MHPAQSESTHLVRFRASGTMEERADVAPEIARGAGRAMATRMKPASEDGIPCIECLQREIAHLLLRNQQLRFELITARQTIARMEARLGTGARKLATALSSERSQT